MSIKDLIGTVPEVPFKVTIDNDSIIKISVAAVLVVTICMLISAVIKIKT